MRNDSTAYPDTEFTLIYVLKSVLLYISGECIIYGTGLEDLNFCLIYFFLQVSGLFL